MLDHPQMPGGKRKIDKTARLSKRGQMRTADQYVAKIRAALQGKPGSGNPGSNRRVKEASDKPTAFESSERDLGRQAFSKGGSDSGSLRGYGTQKLSEKEVACYRAGYHGWEFPHHLFD